MTRDHYHPLARSPKRPRSVRRTLMAFLAGSVVVGTASVAACNHVRYTETLDPEEHVHTVVVQSDAGLVEIVGADHLVVERDVRAPDGALDLDHQVRDGVLYLTARCRTFIPCSVDTRVEIPGGTAVKIEVGRGEVWATGAEALSVDVREGTLDIEAEGPLDVRVGTGTVRAELTRPTVARVAVGAGDVDIKVPPGGWVLDLDALDVVVTDVEPDRTSSARLELVAPAGSVTVHAADRVARR